MPDGDQLFNTVPRCYRGTLRRLLMKQSDDAECAWTLTGAMRDALKASGAEGFAAARAVAHVVSGATEDPRGVDMAEVTRQTRGASRAAATSQDQSILRRVGQALAQDIRDGHITLPPDPTSEVVRRFSIAKVESEFTSRLPWIEGTETRAADGVVKSRLAAAKPDVEREAARFGDQASRKGGFDGLRRSKKQPPPPVDLDEAL